MVTKDANLEVIANSLSQSIDSEDLADLASSVADVGIDATIQSGALNGIPIVGLGLGAFRAWEDIGNALRFRNVVRFLQGLSSTSSKARLEFTARLRAKGKMAEFGEQILLLLERCDEIRKPQIIGRILAAHIEGHIEYEKAMRLAAMVNKSYLQDLSYLKTFKAGVQGKSYDVADQLFSCGLLESAGIDGGIVTDEFSGGTVYELNEYSSLLLKYGLAD